MELGTRTALMKKEKKRGQQDEKNSRSIEIVNRETRFNDTDTDHSSEKSAAINNSGRRKQAEGSSKLFDKRVLKKSGNVRSLDLEDPSIALSPPKPIDVIVDIHREYKERKLQSRGENVKKNKPRGEKVVEKSSGSRNRKIFSARNVLHDKTNEKAEVNSVKNERHRNSRDERRIVDSLDLIEEFQEYPSGEEKNESILEAAMESRLLRRNVSESFVAEKPRGRKQWDVPENIVKIDETKRPRKRWTKDTTVIRLPETKNIFSTASSMENVSPLTRDQTRPVPMARSSLKQELGFDNAAFVSDNEDVLRIETDHNRESTKIEMGKLSIPVEDTQHSSLSNRSRQGSLNEQQIFRDTVVTLEQSNESDEELESRYSGKGEESMSINIENSGETETNDLSSQGKLISRKCKSKKESIAKCRTDSDNSSLTQSFEEASERFDYGPSEEELIEKESRSWMKKKAKKIPKNRSSKSDSYTSQDTLSTNEDDDDDGSLSRKILHEDELIEPIEERRNSRSEGDQDERQNKREKRKVFRGTETNSSIRARRSNIEQGSKKKKKRKKKEEGKKDMKYISITIHRGDMLEMDYVTKHPMVKVHIVQSETGKYLKSLQAGTGNTYLQPIITGKFDFRENKSLIPIWEEELIFEHDFESLVKTGTDEVVILFEIIDLLSFAEASFNYDKFGNEGCWYKVAWAFLKPVGRNNVLHIDKRVRLQLYRPQRNQKRFERHKSEVYTWWKSSSREKYPSSLFVTVTSVDPPKLEPVFYQQLSLHELSDVLHESRKNSTRTSDSINLTKWTRLAAQSCKLPNENFFETEISENGCFFVAFSNDGKYLACVLSEEYDYPIFVYEVETQKIHARFSGHKTFVYSLNWSSNDNHLLSVSSDQTARVWDVRNQIVQHIEMMPHPSYVYCGKFEPDNASVVATGCYDRIARIWVKDKKAKNRDLSQELEGHEGFVNSMCFQKDGSLLTADSVGVIIVWVVKKNRRMLSRKEWHISRKIKVREIEGAIINTIILHPLESRLVVHSRNNGLRILDLATGVVLQKYPELNNHRIQSTACITPCGGLILCGGEDSSLSAWNLETGKCIAKYTIDRNFRAVTCVDYHPYDHVLSFSTFGSPAPVRILRFNKDATGEDVGLQTMEGNDTSARNNDVAMSILNISLSPRERSRSNSRKRTPESISKETNLRPVRTFKSFSLESTGTNVLRKTNERCDAKLRLQRLDETERTLKNRSASRLYNIIEKIDRILSNTSRSSDDVESGRNSIVIQERNENKIRTPPIVGLKKERRKSGKSEKSKLSTCSSIEDHSSSYFESSTPGSVKQEVLELKALRHTMGGTVDIGKKKRSKSAKELRSQKKFEDELSKTFSDGAANSRKILVYDEIMQTIQQENRESSFIVQSMGDNSDSTAFRTKNCFASDHSSSPGSAGTYVVEKADVERNNDGGSVKTSASGSSFHGDRVSNVDSAKMFKSESSTLSSATFTIENEIPIPRPRKKKYVS